MCTIGCVNLDNTYIFKNRDPIRGTPLEEWVEKYSFNILVIKNKRGCYGGLNSEGVGLIGTFVNITEGQVNYFDSDNLITILQQGGIRNIFSFLSKNTLRLFGNIICSDGKEIYSFEMNGENVDSLSITDFYIMTNHFQRINKQIRTIHDPFIAKWTHSRLKRGKELIKAVACQDDIEHLLSDHYGHPDYSICNHGKISTASSYIIDCTNKIIYYCYGCPCRNQYIPYSL